MPTKRHPSITRWQNALMDGIEVGDCEYLKINDLEKIKKDKIDPRPLNGPTKKTLLNIVRRAKFLCENPGVRSDIEKDRGSPEQLLSIQYPGITPELVDLLKRVVVDYNGDGTGYRFYDGQYQNGNLQLGTWGYNLFKNDPERIARYWAFCQFEGETLDPQNPYHRDKINKYAHEPKEIAQDMFEEIIKNNDVMPQNWNSIYNQVQLVVFMVQDQYGPPTLRYP